MNSWSRSLRENRETAFGSNLPRARCLRGVKGKEAAAVAQALMKLGRFSAAPEFVGSYDLSSGAKESQPEQE